MISLMDYRTKSDYISSSYESYKDDTIADASHNDSAINAFSTIKRKMHYNEYNPIDLDAMIKYFVAGNNKGVYATSHLCNDSRYPGIYGVFYEWNRMELLVDPDYYETLQDAICDND